MTALGQYLNYAQALEDEEPERILYLAVPIETYEEFFQLSFVQKSLKRHAINLIVYDPNKKEINISVILHFDSPITHQLDRMAFPKVTDRNQDRANAQI